MAIIAMTREMATLGRDVAAGLAERLGLDIVHHELVAQDIAERAGMRESEVQRFLGGEFVAARTPSKSMPGVWVGANIWTSR